jgi:hypothetical protein
MKIGILVICTGKYSIFWDNFYQSVKKNFLPEFEKKFFVFSDSDINKSSDVEVIYQKKLGWPFDTMYRFKMFNSISNELINFDYLYFLNINMAVVDSVNEEIIPSSDNSNLMGVLHPGFWDKTNYQFPYERRVDSRFYITEGEGKFYYQGCFNGGKSEEFLNMSTILDKMIDEDSNNGITPIWHDESALNWYYKDKPILNASPSYAIPEDATLNFNKKIIQLNKAKFGGHNFLRS